MSSTPLVVWSELYTTYNQTVNQSFHFTDLVQASHSLTDNSLSSPSHCLSTSLLQLFQDTEWSNSCYLIQPVFWVFLQKKAAAHGGLKGKKSPEQNKKPHTSSRLTHSTFNSAIISNKPLQILQHVKDGLPRHDPLKWYISPGIFFIQSELTSRNLRRGNGIKIT